MSQSQIENLRKIQADLAHVLRQLNKIDSTVGAYMNCVRTLHEGAATLTNFLLIVEEEERVRRAAFCRALEQHPPAL